MPPWPRGADPGGFYPSDIARHALSQCANVPGGYAISDGIWNGWITTSTADVWQGWASQEFNADATTAQTVWIQWQTTETSLDVAVAPAPSARDALVRGNRARAANLRRKIAARKAEDLLLQHLTPAQRDEWTASRAFTVHTAGGLRAYRIAYGLAGNVRLIKADEPALSKRGVPLRVGARLCAHVYHPDGPIPNEDNVLAQKLLIECNEQHFLELANVS